jgi:hypothetical protein
MPLNPEILRDLLAEANPEALLIGTETEFDPALLGTAERDGNTVVVYSRERIIDCLIEDGMDPEDAEEWCSHTIEGAHMGEHAPIIIDRLLKRRALITESPLGDHDLG